jgi:O-antigen/teichoic acid export membrane protein
VTRRASYSEGVAFAVLSFASIAVVGLVSSIVVARAYGIDAVGEFAIALAPSAALATLSQLREQAALVRELALLPPRAPRITGLFAAVLTFSLGLTIVTGLLVAVATWFVLSGPVGREDLFLPAIALIAIYTFLENTCWNLDVVFSSFRAGRQLFWVRLVHAVGYVGYAIAFNLVMGDDVWGLVAATCAAIVTVLLHRLILVRRFMRLAVARGEIRSGFTALPGLIRFGVKVAPGAIADGVARQSSIWVLSITVPVTAVGAFNRAWLVVTRLIELNNRVTEMLFPTLVERRASGDRRGFDRASVDSIRYCTAGMLLPAAAGGGAAHGVMQLFGPGFELASDALALLLLVPALAAIAGIQTSVLWSDNRPWLSTIITTSRAVVTVGLTILLALSDGVTGAAVAMVVAYLLDVVWSFAVMRQSWSTPLRELWPFRGMVAVGLAYAVSFAAARGIDAELTGVSGTFAALVAGTLAYVAVAVGVGGVIERDRERLTQLRARRLRPSGVSG